MYISLAYLYDINLVPNFDGGMFAIKNNKVLIPTLIDLSIDFTVLHTRPLGFQITG